VNNTWVDGDPGAGTTASGYDPLTALTDLTAGTAYIPFIGHFSNNASRKSQAILNFGQDHTFSGSKSALTTPYSDANGNGEFYYQPPSGFLALAEIDKAKINTVQRWNGLIGNSVARRTTGGKVIEHSGIITTSEAYQSKL
jgi:hypothetical protein